MLLVIAALLAIAACDPQTHVLKFENPTGEVKIEITADRENILDGWMTEFKVYPFDRKEVTMTTEIYFSNPGYEFVKIEWQNDYSGLITITERDDIERKFKLVSNKELTHLYEIFDQSSK